MNSNPTLLNPRRRKAHLTIPSAKAKNAMKEMRFAAMLRQRSMPLFAPLETASRIDVSVLPMKFSIFQFVQFDFM